MPGQAENLTYRVLLRIRELGLTERGVSLQATGKPDLIRDMKRGSVPSGERLAKLADVLQTTSDWLLRGGPRPDDRMAATSKAENEEGPRWAPALQDFRQRDVPVFGTALGADLPVGDGEQLDDIEQTVIELNEVVDHLSRPIGIIDRKDVYALYIVGSSMEPRYEPGDPVFVDPRRPPSIGDDVIVQLFGDEEGNDEHPTVATALVKRLARRTSSHVELKQYNPETTFRVPTSKIAKIHRIIPVRELAAF